MGFSFGPVTNIIAALKLAQGLVAGLNDLRNVEPALSTLEGVEARRDIIFSVVKLAVAVTPSPFDDAFIEKIKPYIESEQAAEFLLHFITIVTDKLESRKAGKDVDFRELAAWANDAAASAGVVA